MLAEVVCDIFVSIFPWRPFLFVLLESYIKFVPYRHYFQHYDQHFPA